MDDDINTSEDEIFFGPVTIKEIKKSLSLRRKTEVWTTIGIDPCPELNNKTSTDKAELENNQTTGSHPCVPPVRVVEDEKKRSFREDAMYSPIESSYCGPQTSPEPEYQDSPVFPVSRLSRRTRGCSLMEIQEEGSDSEGYVHECGTSSILTTMDDNLVDGKRKSGLSGLLALLETEESDSDIRLDSPKPSVDSCSQQERYLPKQISVNDIILSTPYQRKASEFSSYTSTPQDTHYSRMAPERCPDHSVIEKNNTEFLESMAQQFGRERVCEALAGLHTEVVPSPEKTLGSSSPLLLTNAQYSLISDVDDLSFAEEQLCPADKDGGFLSVLSEVALVHASLSVSGPTSTKHKDRSSDRASLSTSKKFSADLSSMHDFLSDGETEMSREEKAEDDGIILDASDAGIFGSSLEHNKSSAIDNISRQLCSFNISASKLESCSGTEQCHKFTGSYLGDNPVKLEGGLLGTSLKNNKSSAVDNLSGELDSSSSSDGQVENMSEYSEQHNVALLGSSAEKVSDLSGQLGSFNSSGGKLDSPSGTDEQCNILKGSYLGDQHFKSEEGLYGESLEHKKSSVTDNASEQLGSSSSSGSQLELPSGSHATLTGSYLRDKLIKPEEGWFGVSLEHSKPSDTSGQLGISNSPREKFFERPSTSEQCNVTPPVRYMGDHFTSEEGVFGASLESKKSSAVGNLTSQPGTFGSSGSLSGSSEQCNVSLTGSYLGTDGGTNSSDTTPLTSSGNSNNTQSQAVEDGANISDSRLALTHTSLETSGMSEIDSGQHMDNAASGSDNEELNDTWHEMEMMLQYGMEYMLGTKKNDTKVAQLAPSSNPSPAGTPGEKFTSARTPTPGKSSNKASMSAKALTPFKTPNNSSTASRAGTPGKTPNEASGGLKLPEYNLRSGSAQTPTKTQASDSKPEYFLRSLTPNKSEPVKILGKSTGTHSGASCPKSTTNKTPHSAVPKPSLTHSVRSATRIPVSDKRNVPVEEVCAEYVPEQSPAVIVKREGTPAANTRSSAKSTPQPKWGNDFKVPTKPTFRRLALDRIVSPVGQYIRNTPSPSLMQTVRPSSSKQVYVSPAKPPAVWRSDVSPASKENVDVGNLQPVLPMVKYRSVQIVGMDESADGKMPVVGEKLKKLVDTPRPKVTRHQGRVKVPGVPTTPSPVLDDSMMPPAGSEAEVSVVVRRQATRTNTLGGPRC